MSESPNPFGFFRACGFDSGSGSSVREPGARRSQWQCLRRGGARGEEPKEQRGVAGAVEEGHPAADPAAADGAGEPKVAG